MKINLKHGIDQLVFGMKQNDVIAIYGKPNRNYKDEDDNVIFSYNVLKMRLTFYREEDFKLGYIVASSSDMELFENKIIGKKISDVKSELVQKTQVHQLFNAHLLDFIINHTPRGASSEKPPPLPGDTSSVSSVSFQKASWSLVV